MRIRSFHKLIETQHLQKETLNNHTVVVDANNFFYDLYKNSGLQFIFGCESDKFTAYLRKHLSMFQKANVKCYFIFKGGHQDMDKKLHQQEGGDGRNFIIGQQNNGIVRPVFMKDVYKQVLEEMDIDYTICEFEAKRECIALAQALHCPVVSYDILYVFSGQPYIPWSTLEFDVHNNLLKCGVFSLDRFLQNYSLTDDKLAVFAALTDLNIFPEDYFLCLFKSLKISHPKKYLLNVAILKWLGRTSRDRAVELIYEYLNSEDRAIFAAAESNVYNMIRRVEAPGIPSKYILSGNKIDFLEKDLAWFEKGLAAKHIPIPLINISQAGTVVGSWAIADNEAADAMLLAMDIIKYIYNLLTNFSKKELTLYSNGERVTLSLADSVQKPDYEAVFSPFENGWERLPKELFEHFLVEVLDDFVPDKLEIIPENCRMLMISVIYFSKRKSTAVSNEILSLLLSYVALILLSISDKNNNKKITCHQIDVGFMNDEDKQTAREIFKPYLEEVDLAEAEKIFNREWLHPLVEFQHCLEFLNHLNTLCGCPYKTTVFSETFNGTFVYKVLWTVKTQYDGDGEGFVKQLLGPAPTVLKFLTALFQFLKDV